MMFSLAYVFTIFVYLTPAHDATTLKYVHLVFRHGHRTPTSNISYPNDPHKDETFHPFGFGSLTNEGKTAAYQLGEWLRNRYRNFLDELYTVDLVSAISSGTDRTSMTLQIVMAGLFRPKGTLMEWNKDLNWQPTIYKILPPDSKLLTSPFNNNCTTYHDLYKAYLLSDEGRKLLRSYLNLFEYLTHHTEVNTDPLTLTMGTLDKLTFQSQLGHDLPPWASEIFPESLDKAYSDFLLSTSANSKLKQLSGGFLLQRVIQDTNLKLQNKLLPSNQKMTLYSAHDTTIFYFLNALEALLLHRADYTACIIVEVHTIDNVDGIKVLYRDGVKNNLKILTVNGCAEFCPFEQFVEIVSKNIPDDSICKKDKDCC